MSDGDDKGAAGKPDPLKRTTALVLVVLAVAFVAAGIAVYAVQQPRGIDPVQLQWWAGATAKVTNAIRHQPAALFRTALYWDFALTAGYTIGLVLACLLGRRVFWTRPARTWATWGLYATATAAVCNLAQDLLLLQALGNGLRGSWNFDAVEALSFVKFAGLLVAAVVGIAAIVVTLGRLVMSQRTSQRWETARDLEGTTERPLVIPPPMIERAANDNRQAPFEPVSGRDWWKALSSGSRTRWAQGFASPSERFGDSTGICVSGGGIRSASVALGALQALREQGVLGSAHYLVSVSGGGYTAGGLQLAMTQATQATQATGATEASRATPGDAFDPGSPEEDHLRRHSSYIADGLGQLLVALGVLLRNVISSLVIIGLTITTLGLAVGEFYRAVPVVAGGNLALLRPRFAVAGLHAKAPAYPAVVPGVMYAIVAAGALTVLAYLVQQGTVKASVAHRISQVAVALLTVTMLLAVLGLALPALIWVSSWLTWPLGFGPLRAGSVSALSLVATYLGAVAATFWRKRTTIAKSAGNVTGLVNNGPVNQVLPYSMIQMVLLWVCLGFLILVALTFCGWAATSGLVHSGWALIPVGALALLSLVLDQTAISMHPFYRRQLARAFAVRRVERDDVEVAEPYRDDELTRLSTYAEPRDGFPAVTFAATANITSQDRTPPGRPAVPFTFAHDYIGGPATGWVRTDFLERLVGQCIQDDLTVEAAMAISGAAFASAMGSQTRFYEAFLAIANARLGAWLPNPYFVALKCGNPGDWTIPGLPARRRLSYFAREIFAVHPSSGRMLLCTDGGHYENLGLVELLRRRCKVIYCIDASGASQPLADALAGAATLAREELGIEISMTSEARELVSGGWEQLEPSDSFVDLNSRLSKAPVTLGDITYPRVACRPGTGDPDAEYYAETSGKIVFAQAVLSPDVPYQLLDFPQDDPGFPHDSTGDQFFNAGQFDSYQTLGHFIGKEAARRLRLAVPVDAPANGGDPRVPQEMATGPSRT
jgi:hypothetical protein